MTTTEINLTVGLNLHIGSVPVSLAATLSSDDAGDLYTFNGSVQDAEIALGEFMQHVLEQFGVTVELPHELNLKAQIAYVAGQVRYTKPKDSGATTTEMGIAASFLLHYKENADPVKISFYADTILTSGASAKAYVVGAAIDTSLAFSELPLVGSIPVFKEYSLKHLGFSYTNTDSAGDGGKPVEFTLPKVSEQANPLKPKGAPVTPESKSYSIDTKGNQTTFKLDKKGFAFTAGLLRQGSDTALNNFSLPLALPQRQSGQLAHYLATPTVGAVQSSKAATSVNWIAVDKTFGPVDLQKIGLNYSNGEATFGLAAGFAVGGFSLDLQGLSITFPLPLPGTPAGDQVSFNLDGMAMDFKKGGLQIGGAFLKSLQGGYTNYFGQVAIQVSSYGFKAIGGYAPAQDGKEAAFFIYGNLSIPLGGPPFLYVSGLAFGFGVNYALNLPTMKTLPGYLLLPGKAPEQPGKASDGFSKVLEKLAGGNDPVISHQPGQNWVAAGVQFTSFNMISAFALVTVSFGVRMQVGLLGSAEITLPKGAGNSPLAYIEIDLVASFTPETGELPVSGIISPASYLYGGFVKISGGFGLVIWCSGDRKGDFVVSLGGYNSAFNRPPGYPEVPRLQLGFSLGPFQASGSAYMALTPAMFMAGMQFSATFSAGSIRAWFNCGIDFLISWAPFLYRANAYVNVGCSVDLGLFTISVSVGADVQVWGPEFGGKAHVDLDIVSFTIGFGSSSPVPAPVSWGNIEQNFLPGASAPKPVTARSMGMLRMKRDADASQRLRSTAADSNANSTIVAASVATGLLKTAVVDENKRCWDWIIDPDNFLIVAGTSIPASTAGWASSANEYKEIPNQLNDYGSPTVHIDKIPYLTLADSTQHYDEEHVWIPHINVKPMKLRNVESSYRISLCKLDHDGNFNEYIAQIQLQPVLGSSNTALWGDPDAPQEANAAALLKNTLLGFNLLALPRHPGKVSSVPLMQLLFTQGNQTSFRYTGQQSDDRYVVSAKVSAAPAFTLSIQVGGAVSLDLPPDQHFILGALTDDWVTAQRAAVLDDLLSQGMRTYRPDQIDLAAMSSTEALTDWPSVALLSTAPA